MPNLPSDVRLRVIVAITAASVAGFLLIRAGLDSYFRSQLDEQQRTRVAARQAPELGKLRETEAKALREGPLPIDRAVQLVGERGRSAAGEAVEARSSDDRSPLTTPWQGSGTRGTTIPAPPGLSASAAPGGSAPAGASAAPGASAPAGASAAPSASSAPPTPAPSKPH